MYVYIDAQGGLGLTWPKWAAPRKPAVPPCAHLVSLGLSVSNEDWHGHNMLQDYIHQQQFKAGGWVTNLDGSIVCRSRDQTTGCWDVAERRSVCGKPKFFKNVFKSILPLLHPSPLHSHLQMSRSLSTACLYLFLLLSPPLCQPQSPQRRIRSHPRTQSAWSLPELPVCCNVLPSPKWILLHYSTTAHTSNPDCSVPAETISARTKQSPILFWFSCYSSFLLLNQFITQFGLQKKRVFKLDTYTRRHLFLIVKSREAIKHIIWET